jgi:fructokinase
VIAGSPLHVAIHLGALGWDSCLLTRVGDDPDGRAVRKLLHERGIDAALVEVDPTLPTGRVTVDLLGTEPRFTIHGPAAWDAVTGPDRLPDHDVFCYGTLIGRSERAFETLTRLLAQTSAFCALDVNLRPPEPVDDAVRAGLRAATLAKMSFDESVATAEILGIGRDPRALMEFAPKLGWVCVTHGPGGAELHDRTGQSWSVAGEKVDVVDTVGAGDAFFAGLIDGLARGRGGQGALESAQARAIAVVTKRGGLPPID